ncbi:hypothetical protein AB6A40_001020 [Gnathostoma spinigerum]|uniref:FZ domain-containing protein n=1 Tax=Gnathostoma spinigerum TaxID=75299 RepID=A0ABD6E5F4_9BILA
MRNTLKFSHFVFVFIVLGCLWSFVLGSDSAVVKGHNKSRAILDSLRRQFAGFHANCVQTDWACSRSCRLQFPHNITGKCLKPALSDSCFGIPITYNYTYDNAIERELLPRYEVLKNFPRCWSAIGPLLCAVLYRPCSVRKYMEMEMDKPGLIELWQLIRRSVCYHAKNECSFLLKEGLWPEIINCSQLNVNSTRRRIFAESNCKMPYNEAPSTVHHHQCLWPLVSSYGSYQNAKPVLDNCYLPCKSSLISSQWLYNTFRSVLSIVSSLIFTLSFILFIYLSLFSSIWLESLCVYSLGNSLLCCSAHWGMWALSYFDRISSDIVCVDSGRIRKEHYNLPKIASQFGSYPEHC